MNAPTPKRSSTRGLMVFLGLGMAHTITIGVAAFVGWFGGTWLDRKTGWAPTFMIVGIVLCMSLSLVHAIRSLKRAQDQIEDS